MTNIMMYNKSYMLLAHVILYIAFSNIAYTQPLYNLTIGK